MAGENTTTETVRLELETNFSDVLKANLSFYERFTSKINDSSRTLESSFSDMAKGVSKNIESMFGSSAKQIINSVQQSQGLIVQLLQKNVKANEFYVKTFEKLIESNRKFRSEIEKTQDSIERLNKIKTTGGLTTTKQKNIDKEVAELNARKSEIERKMNAEAIRLRTKFADMLSSTAAQSSKGLVELSKAGLDSVKRTVDDIGNQLNKLKSQFALQSDASKLLRYQEHFEAMKIQHASLQKTLQEQSKRTVQAEKEMSKAKLAWETETTEKIKAENEKRYGVTVKNLTEIKTAYKETESQVYKYGEAVRKSGDEIKGMAEAMKKNIAAGIRPSDLNANMKKAMALLVEQAKLSGKDAGEAFAANLAKTRKAEDALNSYIIKLKEMREEAKLLEKTGLINTKVEQQKINSLLERYKNFIAEYKQQQKLVDTYLSGKDSKVTDAGVSELNNLLKKYNELGVEVQKFGNIQSNNFMEAHALVKKLEIAWNEYLAKRESLIKREQVISAKMAELRIAIERQANKQIAVELEKHYSVLKSQLKDVRASLAQAFVPPSTIKSTFDKVTEAAQKAQASLALKIKPSYLNANMKKAMDLLVEQAKLAGKDAGEAFAANLAESRKVEGALNRNIIKLKEMREEAKLLEKTGLINTKVEQKKIDDLLEKYRTFVNEYKQQQKLVDTYLSGGKGSQIKDTGASELNNLLKKYNELGAEAQKFGKINITNFTEAHALVKKLESAWNEYSSKRKSLMKEEKDVSAQMAELRIVIERQANKRIAAELEKHYSALKAKLGDIRNSLAQAFVSPANIKYVFNQVVESARKAQADIAASFRSTNVNIESGFNNIAEQYRKLTLETDKLSKKRFVSKGAIAEAQAGFERLKNSAKEYTRQIEILKNQIKRLEEIQRAGLGGKGIQADIETMRSGVAAMNRHIQSLNVHATQAQRQIDALQTRSLKGILKNGWEMIRNFRWQVAAVIYLISRAVRGVQRVFTGTMEEIAKYRREAMTLAAQFSYQLLGDMRGNFDKVYGYSRQLMQKMEQVAARTILTMEDMTMLVRTFAQAGVIPDPKKDIEKIAMIGTAIKTLTEGMANAGVQMRQELYALIAGRQRVTDQVAMMFGMMGISIKKVLNDARHEGKQMIDVLSEALAPFGILNEKLALEWEAVLNNMKLAWQVIKRFGLEDVLLKTAKTFNTYVEKFYDTISGNVTELGRKVAASLRIVYELLIAWVSTLKSEFFLVLGIVDSIVQTFSALGSGAGLTAITDSARNLSSSMRGIVGSAEIFLKIMAIVKSTVDLISITVASVAAALHYVWVTAGAIPKRTIGLLEFVTKGTTTLIDESVKEVGEAYKRMEELGKSLIDSPKKAKEEYQQVEQTIKDILKLLDAVGKKEFNLEKVLLLNYDPMKLLDETLKFKNEINQAELAGLRGPEKFEAQYRQQQEKIRELRTGIVSNITQLQAFYDDALQGEYKLTTKDWDALKTKIKNHKTALNEVYRYEKFILRQRDQAIADFLAKEKKRLAQQRADAQSFLVEAYNRPETREDKTNKWYDSMVIRLEELRETNQEVAKDIDKYWSALFEGLHLRQKQDFDAIEEDFKQMRESINSHKELNPYEKIDNEMDKMKLKVNEQINEIGKDKADILLRNIELARDERKEIEKIHMQYENSVKEVDILSKKASYLADSFKPSEQQKGAVLGVLAEFKKATLDYQQQLKLIDKQWKDNNGNWKTNSEEAQKYADLLKKEFAEIYEAAERELWRKMHPLWDSMNQMSKSWADGLADSLTDLVLDFENFSKSIKSLWESIVRDALKATIKHTVTDKLMDIFGSGEPGSSTLFQKNNKKQSSVSEAASILKNIVGDTPLRKGGSVLDQILESGKPIPVYITDSFDLASISDGVKKTTDAINENGSATKDSLENGFRNNQSIFSNLLSTLGSAGGYIGSGGGKSNATMSLLTTIGGAVASYYGGPAAGAAVGAAGNAANSGSSRPDYSQKFSFDTSSYSGGGQGMAEGGVISEHIVGKGLRSGRMYEFGERAKYGEFEDVVPKDKMVRSGGQVVSISMPINLSAVDTVSGVDFIMKHQKVIETNMMRSMKNNKAIRVMMNKAK